MIAVSCLRASRSARNPAHRDGHWRGPRPSWSVAAEELQPLAGGQDAESLVDKEQPLAVILGKQAIDDDCNQTGQMLAALADLPQATFAQGRKSRRRKAQRHARGRRRPGRWR